ncbi:hypothetical protein E2C01_057420 [Portunus trituberculatus]|uniref:Uncharacterized protein n=1 Tax=Portunus trituberculatus TaxID=210409 RepID=A0A5B7GWR3_PORTR|nr:hypothetical protein [Portunus trituberculatus]
MSCSVVVVVVVVVVAVVVVMVVVMVVVVRETLDEYSLVTPHSCPTLTPLSPALLSSVTCGDLNNSKPSQVKGIAPSWP